LNRFRQLQKENGIYIASASTIAFLLGLLRNGLLARKFGVNKIRIGSRAYLRGLTSIQMGEDFSALDGLWLEAVTAYNDQRFKPRIVIGNHVRISQSVHIAATNLVEIGDHTLIGSRVIITDHNHGQYGRTHTSPRVPPTERLLDGDRQVTIGRNVWLGDGVVVAPGAAIGEGSVIGANSVVLGSIPAYSIAAGAPATVRKMFNFTTQKWTSSE
jgi:lipopolysaccharide O-acetyltransferase